MSSGQKAAGQRLESRSRKGRKILKQNFAKTYYIGQSKWPNVKS